jgi:FemAB-related protein (PEP-CTERM system-associated)
MKVSLLTSPNRESWDNYVLGHPDSSHCHLSGWLEIIEKTYGHRSYGLVAQENSRIVGLLPFIHMKSFMFGNRLVSMPFLNYGGVLADTPDIARALLEEAVHHSSRLKVSLLELRHLQAIENIESSDAYDFRVRTDRVRMTLELPNSADELFNSFKSKLRSQIRRPLKEGMTSIIGGDELLPSFYKVFSVNMRDLGSPVHNRKLFSKILETFGEKVKIGLVSYHNEPVAAGLIVCYGDTVEIPWASSLRKYNRLSPNMLLYWSLLEYSCNQGFRHFDFGRSSANAGTYKFKKQWGAEPNTLYWYVCDQSKNKSSYMEAKSPTMTRAAAVWQKLPLFLANLIGPTLRRSIPL